MRVMQFALGLGLLTTLLCTGVVGCGSLTRPPVQSLDQWMREDAAVRSSAG
jgi:hypothetical protein